MTNKKRNDPISNLWWGHRYLFILAAVSSVTSLVIQIIRLKEGVK